MLSSVASLLGPNSSQHHVLKHFLETKCHTHKKVFREEAGRQDAFNSDPCVHRSKWFWIFMSPVFWINFEYIVNRDTLNFFFFLLLLLLNTCVSSEEIT
jgi:hypothetical protein